MSRERLQMPSGQLLNERSSYIKELRLSRFHMTEVKITSNPFNAILYQQENSQEHRTRQPKNNLLFLTGASGESGSTSHISASFLSELNQKVDTVIGYNSAISKTALGAKKYEHDLNIHSEQIIALYEQGIPENKRDQPVVLVGHSMGGSTAPVVARKLMERGFTVSKIVLIAPPGLSERSDIHMLKNFLQLSSKKQVYADIPVLYPSPADIESFIPRIKELSRKTDLTIQEKEEMATYHLAIQRQANPDKLTLSNISKRRLVKIKKIDEELQQLVDQTYGNDKTRIDKLQEKRRRMLLKPIRKVIVGKINNERTQKRAKSKEVAKRIGNTVKSIGELKKTVSEMASEITLQKIQELIDYHDVAASKYPLDIAVIAGSNDPIAGTYKVGDITNQVSGGNITISEIGMINFNHMSLPDDPVRVARVINRLMESKINEQKAQELAMI